MEGVSTKFYQNILLTTDNNSINKELTAKMQKLEKYVNFNNWLKANGVVYDGVEYPVVFGQYGLIGAAATKDIAPLTAFISIPNKIIISYDRARFSELKSFFKQSEDLFSEKENDEAGVNVLTVFFMYERLKSKKSLWNEYFEILENNETILTWTAEEINGIPDPYIQKQAREYKEQVDELWDELKQLLHSQPNFFSKSTATKELFLWAYNIVMSRCFGYTQKGTCIVPFADCLNHNKYHATYFYVHKEFELNQASKHPQYIIKKRTLDLSIVDPLLANKVTPTLFKNEVFNFVRNYKEDALFNDSSVRSQMISTVRQINMEQLQKNQDQEIWTSQFFTTSDEEDNDTDSEDEEEKKKAREISTLKLKESSSMREALERVRRYEEKLRNQPKMSQEDEERANQDRRKADESYQQQLLENQKKKLEQEAKEGKIQQDEELELKNIYYLNEDDYDWYNCQDNQIYFIFASNKPIVKGEQIFNFYGRRTNRHLICWYGFTFQPNEYDSLSFRLFLHKKSEEINENNIKEILYSDYISYEEWENGVKIGEKIVPTDVLSKEFRLKDGLLCDELINYMRINKMQHYNGLDRDLIMLTQPKSINFELRCIEAALIVIKELKDRYLKFSSQIKEMPGQIQGGKNSSIPIQVAHQQFSKILYDGHFRALEKQIALFNISKEILQEIAKGTENFKSIYLKLYPQFETEQDYPANREYLRKYLKAINDGIVTNIKQK
ncbi:hypothetical protein ABPG72_014172 [Tetrahymena utriculariae]